VRSRIVLRAVDKHISYAWHMTKKPRTFRKTLDYLGITESEEERQQRGTKAWWIKRIIFISFIMLLLFVLRSLDII
jgi:hypothetical protein